MPHNRRFAAITSLVALVLTGTSSAALAQPAPEPNPSFSKAQLADTHQTLDARLAQAPDGIAYWGEDPASGRVVVGVLASDRTAQTKAKAALKGLPAGKVELVDKLPQPYWNLVGGQAINASAGGRCSVGFSTQSSSGSRYVITAGHCTEIGGTWRGTGGTIGAVAATSFPSNDFGAIGISSTSAVSTALVDRYSSGSDVTVAGAGTAGVGAGICRSGSTTGWRCGSVTATNQTVNYGGGDIVSGLTRTTACAEPGDSGGSYVTNPGSGTRVTALGLLSGGSGDCTSGGVTYYQPVGEVLSNYGLTLVTG
jgi:streptogrisin C